MTALESYEMSLLLKPSMPQILPYIDGFRHISKIATEADVEVSLVKACVQNMIYYGVISLIPIFQYSNVYLTTPLLVHLAESVSLQDECIRSQTEPMSDFNNQLFSAGLCPNRRANSCRPSGQYSSSTAI